MVNLLMFQPVSNGQERGTINLIPLDACIILQLDDPIINQARRIIVVRVEKAREHSRGRASPPVIVNQCPQLDE